MYIHASLPPVFSQASSSAAELETAAPFSAARLETYRSFGVALTVSLRVA